MHPDPIQKNTLRTVAIIPARHGSTRLPAKPLVDLCGKPMVQHVYERTAQARLVHQVIVATDHPAIADAVKSFGGEAIMTPSDLQSGSDRIAYAARLVAGADLIVNVQGDEPLILPDMIDQAITPLLNDRAIVVGTLVKEIHSAEEIANPNIVKAVLDREGNALYFSRSPIPCFRDAAPETWHSLHQYYKHIGLYVYRREFLIEYASWPESRLERAERLEQLRILENGYRIHAAVTVHDTIPIDTSDDVARVRRIMLEHSMAGGG